MRGDLQARLRHQRQQAHGLERDGFAARVGAGDDERLEFFAQPQVVGYDGCRIDQRMARAQQTDAAFPVQLGRNRVHFAPQARLGEDGVQLGEQGDVVGDQRRVRRYAAGKLRQNALDFALLFGHPLLEVVANFHHGHGLDKQRGAAAGLIVHQSGHKLPAFRAHGNDIAPVAHGDDGILQIFLQAGIADISVEPLAHFVVERADVAANVVQFRRGAVGDFVFRKDGVINLFL